MLLLYKPWLYCKNFRYHFVFALTRLLDFDLLSEAHIEEHSGSSNYNINDSAVDPDLSQIQLAPHLLY